MSIRVLIADSIGAKVTPVELPADVPMKRLVPALVTKMSMPTGSPDGRPHIYHIDHRRSGKRLGDEETLVSAGVQEGDLLRLIPEVTAGGPSPGARLAGDTIVEPSPPVRLELEASLPGEATIEPSPPLTRITVEDIEAFFKPELVINKEELTEEASLDGGNIEP